MSTDIEWTEETWNPVRGCDPVSPGCANCYAMRQAGRFSGPGKPYEGLVQLTKNGRGYRWTGDFREIPEMLQVPMNRKKPTAWFVNSMSDLFGEGVTDEFIDAVLGVAMFTPQHTYQILTKRAERMAHYWQRLKDNPYVLFEGMEKYGITEVTSGFGPLEMTASPKSTAMLMRSVPFPIRNVWAGVSVENADYLSRLDELRKIDAAIRMVSFEPLLGDLGKVDLAGIHWAIIGGESGNGSRVCDIKWIESIVAQCQAANVATYVKQLGKLCRLSSREPTPEEQAAAKKRRKRGQLTLIETYRRTEHSKGGDIKEWPKHLQVREMPELRQ
jgi:protein gp37